MECKLVLGLSKLVWVFAHNTFSYLEQFIEPPHHHKQVPSTPGVAKTLHVQCLKIVSMICNHLQIP
jgi:hypothetical protein